MVGSSINLLISFYKNTTKAKYKFKIKRHATLKKIELTTIKVVDAAIKEPKTNIKDKIDKLEISRRVDF